MKEIERIIDLEFDDKDIYLALKEYAKQKGYTLTSSATPQSDGTLLFQARKDP